MKLTPLADAESLSLYVKDRPQPDSATFADINQIGRQHRGMFPPLSPR